MDGLLNLDKPPGLSSARAVDRVKRLLPRGSKIGHAGTLDPFATGVLLLLIGRATKTCEHWMAQPKQYETTLKLGATTVTDDPESPERPTPDLVPVTRAQVEAVLPQFIGAIQQRPPAYSAMKVAGRRAYDLARQGHEVRLEPRRVQVYGIELLDFDWPTVSLRIDCGRGTYIRSLARDIGIMLQSGAYLVSLRRTRIGSFNVADGAQLGDLTAENVLARLHSV